MNLTKLIKYLRDEGPHDQPPTSTSPEETPLPNEGTFEEEDGENEDPQENSIEEEETLWRRGKSLLRKRTPRRILLRRRKTLRMILW